ncbi:MAG: hypothetical protein PVG39_09440 [Desulfobacteraceae bacterium]|jgi:hypothetical protein
MRLFFTGCIVFIMLSAATVWPHGTHGGIVNSDGYLITAKYDDGEPMNYAEVNINSPGSDIPFQTGRTDLLGHFLFKPNSPGKWEIEVLDGMGHRLALELTVDDNKVDSSDKKNDLEKGDIRPVWKAVVGISVIFGFSGIIYGWRAKQLSNAANRDDTHHSVS